MTTDSIPVSDALECVRKHYPALPAWLQDEHAKHRVISSSGRGSGVRASTTASARKPPAISSTGANTARFLMPNPTQLRDLAERLERATGPDRELDVRIHMLVNPPVGVIVNGMGANRFLACAQETGDWEGAGRAIDALRITSSIDAAVALTERLLPEMCWTIDSNQGLCTAKLFCDGDEGEGGWWDEVWHIGANAALALLRAMVTAMIAKEEGNG